MEIEPITESEIRLIALEEGLKAAFSLDCVRIQMLNQAVDMLCDQLDLSKNDVRRLLIGNRGKHVARNLATMSAVRGLLRE